MAALSGGTAGEGADDASKEGQKRFFDEFHPFLLKQHEGKQYITYPSFDRAVDIFFSEMEAQKLEMKTISQENAALKKLENVKKDHERRLQVRFIHFSRMYQKSASPCDVLYFVPMLISCQYNHNLTSRGSSLPSPPPPRGWNVCRACNRAKRRMQREPSTSSSTSRSSTRRSR